MRNHLKPSDVFYKKAVPKVFKNLTGKHLCEKCLKFSRTPFFIEHLW